MATVRGGSLRLPGSVVRPASHATYVLDVKPRGRLLVANFLPDIEDVGYMEAYMGWRLNYRTADEMAATANTIPPPRTEARRTFMEDNETIVYLEVRRV